MNGSSIILCTLGMLSNPVVEDHGVFNLVPVEKLVVDEASQIDVFEFMVSAVVQNGVDGTDLPLLAACIS